MANKLIFTDKFKPGSMDEIILPDRIKSTFPKGKLTGDFLFVGKFGVGKTTLADILTANNPTLKFNGSKEGTMEFLNDVIEPWCSHMQDMDMFDELSSDTKIIYMDEADGAGYQFQLAFRNFMNKYSDRVRFVATCNHESKIHDEFKDRFDVLRFNFYPHEIMGLKEQYAGRMKYIASVCRVDVSDDVIMKLTHSHFPSFRKPIQLIQRWFRSGKKSVSVDDLDEHMIRDVEFYRFILDNNHKIDGSTAAQIHYRISDKAVSDPNSVMMSLDEPFIDYIIAERMDKAWMIPHIISIISENTDRITRCQDPSLPVKNAIWSIVRLSLSRK